MRRGLLPLGIDDPFPILVRPSRHSDFHQPHATMIIRAPHRRLFLQHPERREGALLRPCSVRETRNEKRETLLIYAFHIWIPPTSSACSPTTPGPIAKRWLLSAAPLSANVLPSCWRTSSPPNGCGWRACGARNRRWMSGRNYRSSSALPKLPSSKPSGKPS